MDTDGQLTSIVASPPGQFANPASVRGEAISPKVKKCEPEFVIPLHIIAAGLALVLAVVALACQFFRNPMGPGLAAYDFTTPKTALESELKMALNHDIRAHLELSQLLQGPRSQEKFKTLEIRKEVDWRGKVILFVRFEQDGILRHETTAFEKDARSGLWFQSHVSSYEVKDSNRRLADMLDAWSLRGEMLPN